MLNRPAVARWSVLCGGACLILLMGIIVVGVSLTLAAYVVPDWLHWLVVGAAAGSGVSFAAKIGVTR